MTRETSSSDDDGGGKAAAPLPVGGGEVKSVVKQSSGKRGIQSQ